MANPEHLQLVEHGADAINAWKQSHPQLRLDLQEAELRDANLHGADLRAADLTNADLSSADLGAADLSDAVLKWTNLTGTDLSFAKLAGANLDWAKLRDADLSGAKLSRANLNSADLVETILRGADLRNASLWDADLIGADLREANFTGAICAETSFDDIDLSTVIGLEHIEHRGPSWVGIETLFESAGRIPETFLRGCGVYGRFIDIIPSIVSKTTDSETCRISYDVEDEVFAKRLHARMRLAKLRVWLAPMQWKFAVGAYEETDLQTHACDRLIVILSNHSMSSEWIEFELRIARQRQAERNRRLLFPVGLVATEAIEQWHCVDSDSADDLADTVRSNRIPNFSDRQSETAFETAFAHLCEDLRSASGAADASRRGA